MVLARNRRYWTKVQHPIDVDEDDDDDEETDTITLYTIDAVVCMYVSSHSFTRSHTATPNTHTKAIVNGAGGGNYVAPNWTQIIKIQHESSSLVCVSSV